MECYIEEESLRSIVKNTAGHLWVMECLILEKY